MTALKGRDIDSFLKKRSEHVCVALIYGPDQGLVRDRAQMLGKQIVEDLNDPFNAIELTDQDLDTVGKLSDEATALSFMGGERLIRLRGHADIVTKSVTLLLGGLEDERLKPNALVVIEAGDLKKSNGLRKICEKSKHAVALPCYQDNDKDMLAIVRESLSAENISIRDDALSTLVSRLGDDRGISRSEIEKLILYVGPASLRQGEAYEISIEDINACLVDSAADATFELVDLTLGGQPQKLSEALFRAQTAGVSAIAAVRILQGKLLRLLTAQRLIREGEGVGAAMKKLRPPVFFGEQRSFEHQLKKWPLQSLERAAQDLLDTDMQAKSTGLPQREIVERTLLRMSMMASRR